jgi:hypothetical protein
MNAEKSAEAEAVDATEESAKATAILRPPPDRFEFSCLLPLLQIPQ